MLKIYSSNATNFNVWINRSKKETEKLSQIIVQDKNVHQGYIKDNSYDWTQQIATKAQRKTNVFPQKNS